MEMLEKHIFVQSQGDSEPQGWRWAEDGELG